MTNRGKPVFKCNSELGRQIIFSLMPGSVFVAVACFGSSQETGLGGQIFCECAVKLWETACPLSLRTWKMISVSNEVQASQTLE